MNLTSTYKATKSSLSLVVSVNSSDKHYLKPLFAALKANIFSQNIFLKNNRNDFSTFVASVSFKADTDRKPTVRSHLIPTEINTSQIQMQPTGIGGDAA